MQVSLIAFLQNILTVQTILLSILQNVRGFGTFSCLRESIIGQGHTCLTFLRDEDRIGLILFATLWSEDMRLLTCEINTSPLAIGNYSALCNGTSEDERLISRFNLNATLSSEAKCKKDAPNVNHSSTTEEAKLRRKRSWIFPGTLWCGTGSKAFGFNELGMFESADRCCREHDHCLHIIPAFTVNYGVFNPNFYTVSHCDCDQRFRQCLLDVNDTISSMVFYSFFKILKVPCFELEVQKRCTKLYWWGMCKVTQEAPYAIFKKPIYYNISLPNKLEKGDSSKSAVSKAHLFTGIQEIKSPRKKLWPREKCISKDPPRGDTFIHMKKKGCRRYNGEQSTVAANQQTTTSLKTDKSSKTKGMKSLSIHSAALISANHYVTASSTTPTTAPSFKTSAALHLKKEITTKKVSGQQEKKAFQSQNKNASLTTMFPAVTPTKSLSFTGTLTKILHYNENTTTADVFAHYLESQVQTPFPVQETNKLTNNRHTDTRQNKPLFDNKTDLCECLKHLDTCRYKIPPLKKRFGLKNLDTKPVYHCSCTKRLALEMQSLKQSSVLSFLVDLVSENCFKIPKKKKCLYRKRCSGEFSKASDLLQALKKIQQNDIARVQNSGKLRKRRISVQLYKRCLRLRKDAMARLR